MKRYCILAGGCFWCMARPFYDAKGILEIYSGYSGGEEVNPTYKDVKARIKDKLLDDFQENYCIVCGSQRCDGDLRDGCSYYKSYVNKIGEVFEDMKGEANE